MKSFKIIMAISGLFFVQSLLFAGKADKEKMKQELQKNLIQCNQECGKKNKDSKACDAAIDELEASIGAFLSGDGKKDSPDLKKAKTIMKPICGRTALDLDKIIKKYVK